MEKVPVQSENATDFAFSRSQDAFLYQRFLDLSSAEMVSLAQLRPSLLNAARHSLHNARLHGNVIFSRSSSFGTTLAEDMWGGEDSTAPPVGPTTYYNPITAMRQNEPKKDALEPPKPYHLHVYTTHNNCRIVFTYPSGKLVKNGWWTSGSCGFKGANKSTYEAGYQCAVRAFKRIEEEITTPNFKDGGVSPVTLALKFKGFGWGREAVQKAFMTSEGDNIRSSVVVVEDRTPIKIGGTRAKKARRL
ncbi:translational machinery component [Rhizopogon vinicolor AM-OR11-026]|uniref:Translational machinery component n=1 Tax=Rhizopogon vinicolor AM-OR11-026 TaxID=1314800 RepID=A0A1B7N2V9_9AGAM|nr:translational machinery component [Rhizopogon vinicolor AM-OR11-026]